MAQEQIKELLAEIDQLRAQGGHLADALYAGQQENERLQIHSSVLMREIDQLRADNAWLRQAIAYMEDHADSPTIIRREASRALEPRP